jgi:hypothetical protein
MKSTSLVDNLIPLRDEILFIIFNIVYIWREKVERSLFFVDDEIINCRQFALVGRFFLNVQFWDCILIGGS